MDYTQMTKDLLAGSAEINRMRGEIKVLVGMLKGILEVECCGKRIDTAENVAIAAVAGHKVCWYIHLKHERNGECHVRISCRAVADEKAWYFFSSTGECDLDHVQEVYESLPVLVGGMLEHFPDVERRLLPFLKAAQKTSRSYFPC